MRSEWKRPDFQEDLPLGIRRIRIDVSYIGTYFSGFQSQANKNGVEDFLEKALFSLLGKKTKLFASGRTDCGVHSISQTCHFDTDSSIDVEKFPLAINAHLSTPFIKVMKAKEENGTFHSRFSALAREYHYYMKFNKNHTVFDKNRVFSLPFDFDDITLTTLNNMALLVKGEKDFSFLSLKENEEESHKRDIYISEFYKKENLLVYRIVGNAFLYHQVRSIIGTILDVYRKSKNEEEALEIFGKIVYSKTRSNKIVTAPPYALYFYKTIYDEKEWEAISREIENGCSKV